MNSLCKLSKHHAHNWVKRVKGHLEELVVNMKAYLKLCACTALLTSILLISHCGNTQGTYICVQ